MNNKRNSILLAASTKQKAISEISTRSRMAAAASCKFARSVLLVKASHRLPALHIMPMMEIAPGHNTSAAVGLNRPAFLPLGWFVCGFSFVCGWNGECEYLGEVSLAKEICQPFLFKSSIANFARFEDSIMIEP